MPEFWFVPGRMSAKARAAFDRTIDAAAARVESNRAGRPSDPAFYPTVEGRLVNQDKIVERSLARKLSRRRARIRRGRLGGLRTRVLGMRRLNQRVERTKGRYEDARSAHTTARTHLSNWREEVGYGRTVPILSGLVLLFLVTVGAFAETVFSSGAAELLISTTGVVPDWAEQPLALLLAFLFGLGTVVLTKSGVEEALLVRFRFPGRKDRARGDEKDPYAGRSPAGRAVRTGVAFVAVVLIIGFSAHLRDSAAGVKAGAAAQPVQAGASLGAGAAKGESKSSASDLEDGGFLALGIGTVLVMAAVTLIAMDAERIHGKRLATAERRARQTAAFRSWRHALAVNLLEIARDRDADSVRSVDLALTSHRATSSEILLDQVDKRPGLFGNVWPGEGIPESLEDLGLPDDDLSPVPTPVERFDPPAAEGDLPSNGNGNGNHGG